MIRDREGREARRLRGATVTPCSRRQMRGAPCQSKMHARRVGLDASAPNRSSYLGVCGLDMPSITHLKNFYAPTVVKGCKSWTPP